VIYQENNAKSQISHWRFDKRGTQIFLKIQPAGLARGSFPEIESLIFATAVSIGMVINPE
jgi:hypothetical protein